jgi:hypothetical protein
MSFILGYSRQSWSYSSNVLLSMITFSCDNFSSTRNPQFYLSYDTNVQCGTIKQLLPAFLLGIPGPLLCRFQSFYSNTLVIIVPIGAFILRLRKNKVVPLAKQAPQKLFSSPYMQGNDHWYIWLYLLPIFRELAIISRKVILIFVSTLIHRDNYIVTTK